MSESTPRREVMQAQVANARAQLAEIAQTLSEADLVALRVTPEWNGLDMLRHVLFWNDTVLESLEDWAGSHKLEQADDFDTFNHRQVQARAGLGREVLLAQISGAYDRYDMLLNTSSDAELLQPGIAAWGERMDRLGLIGVVGHDEEHYAHIRVAAGS